jgi:hypothetical protein
VEDTIAISVNMAIPTASSLLSPFRKSFQVFPSTKFTLIHFHKFSLLQTAAILPPTKLFKIFEDFQIGEGYKKGAPR